MARGALGVHGPKDLLPAWGNLPGEGRGAQGLVTRFESVRASLVYNKM